MISLNFYLFLGILELMLILVIITYIQFRLIKKYRPYFLSNTRPEQFLRKYIQRLIKQTRKFAKGFQKAASDGDDKALRTRQRMTARLNWLILERDFAVTTEPDIRYWEDLNNRIKRMLKEWKEIEIIKEPPDLEVIKLALDKEDLDEIDFENMDISQAAKDQIASLKKRIFAMSGYESMYKELEMAYRTLEETYNELKKGVKEVELEAKEADKLRGIIQQQEAHEANLNAMLEEVERSKDRLNEELEQLENAYEALEHEVVEGTHTNILKKSENPDAQEILGILTQQENILNDLRKSVSKLGIKPSQKDKLESHADEIAKTNKEINHCMQMLELERERLADELKQLQEDGALN